MGHYMLITCLKREYDEHVKPKRERTPSAGVLAFWRICNSAERQARKELSGVLANLKFASSEYEDLKSDKNGHNLFWSLRGIIALKMLILTAAEFQIRLNGGGGPRGLIRSLTDYTDFTDFFPK